MTDALRPSPEAALAAWGARVRGNREQAERFREAPARPDFYAPVASVFKADPHRTDEPTLELLRSLVQPGDTWLDIGAGGGRYALPIALLAREVVALDPSDGMLAVLREGAAESGITNVRVVQSRWPSSQAIAADVCLISHVGYDIEEIGPFLDAMEAAASRTCVAVLLSESPAGAAARFWPAIHREPRVALPALPEFLTLLLSRGRFFDVTMLSRPPLAYPTPDAALGFLRQQLFIEAGGAKDAELQRLVRSEVSQVDGRFALARAPTPLGVVRWSPR